VDRVLIVGGGIGGLALAGALGRRGVEAHVLDNQPEWTVTSGPVRKYCTKFAQNLRTNPLVGR
jgi:2-polyprenyl-6-methoxyphenol hydroxylase-like FAD-dependent oxidoreductase